MSHASNQHIVAGQSSILEEWLRDEADDGNNVDGEENEDPNELGQFDVKPKPPKRPKMKPIKLSSDKEGEEDEINDDEDGNQGGSGEGNGGGGTKPG